MSLPPAWVVLLLLVLPVLPATAQPGGAGTEPLEPEQKAEVAQNCEEALVAARTLVAAKDAELTTAKEALRDRAGSLTELVATGVLTEAGVRVVPVSKEQRERAKTVKVVAAHLYVARGRMALEVTLVRFRRGDKRPWVPGLAQLTQHGTPAPVGRVRLLEGPMLEPDDQARLVVEWDAPEAHPEKPPPLYALEIQDQTGRDRLRFCLGSQRCGARKPWGK